MMGFSALNCLITFALIAVSPAVAEEGSLRSALNAMSKRQQDLGDYPKYSDDFYPDSDRYGYSYMTNNNALAFLNPSDKNNQDYKDGYEYDDNENINQKRISSAFRERIEEDKSKQREKFENMLMTDINDIYSEENSEYLEFLHELWEKYGRSYPELLNYYKGGHGKGEIRKRSHSRGHYPSLGLDSVGMKKRSYTPSEVKEHLYLVNYSPEDASDYVVSKRFPVTKRSSNYYPIPYSNEISRHVKRSSKNEVPVKTDPKVAEDLSSIFNVKHETQKKAATKPKRTEHVIESETKKPKIITTTTSTTTKRPEKKETANEIATEIMKEKPIQLKKKSIDWSDYFGIDRRKKSENLDNEWLMERYHKAVALGSKRDSEAIRDDKEKPKNQKTTEDKIIEMDTKLKNIEYAIVDDALKFTGAHEGAVDSKEIQEIKDRVISQLAAAYNLEKMRKALGEYKKIVAKERGRMKEIKEDSDKVDEKRLSVPRKSAEMSKADDNDAEGENDNNIKCTDDDDNCNKETYGEIIDAPNLEYCPKIQRVCSELATALGHYGKVFEPACAMHQICLLCGDNTWFSPTRQCNVLFVNKAEYLCGDDTECREVARYLLEVNHLFKPEPLDSCDLVC